MVPRERYQAALLQSMLAMNDETPVCVFCRILRGELAPGVVAYREAATAVFSSLRQQPRNRGHMQVVPTQHVARRISTLVERVGLPGVESKKCEELSKGMLQKIQFVAAIIHEPDLLILDEPFSGLDPISMRLLRDQIV
ncbi:MAG: ATP-binding cassette domain-containing protein, partial [Lysobacterales bacterium]